MYATLIAIAGLWLIFVVQVVCDKLGIDFTYWMGVIPRQPSHLHGIITAHLVHGSWAHLTTNSLALLIAGVAIRWATPNLVAGAVTVSAILAGVLTWCIGSTNSLHIGASGVIFGLVGFLLMAALVRLEWRSLLAGLLIALLYGGSWVLLFPNTTTTGQSISWQMHLGGGVGGALYAWMTRAERPRKHS